MAYLAGQEHRGHRVLLAPRARLDGMVLPVNQVCVVHPELPGFLEHPVGLDQPDNRVSQELTVETVHRDYLEHLVEQVLQVYKVFRELLDRLDLLAETVSLELLALQVLQVGLVHQVHLVELVARANVAFQVPRVIPVYQDEPELLDLRDYKVFKDVLVLLAHPGFLVRLDQQDLLVLLEESEQVGILELQDSPEHPDKLVLRVSQETPAIMDYQADPELPVPLEDQVPLEPLVSMVKRATAVSPALMEDRAPRELRV